MRECGQSKIILHICPLHSSKPSPQQPHTLDSSRPLTCACWTIVQGSNMLSTHLPRPHRCLLLPHPTSPAPSSVVLQASCDPQTFPGQQGLLARSTGSFLCIVCWGSRGLSVWFRHWLSPLRWRPSSQHQHIGDSDSMCTFAGTESFISGRTQAGTHTRAHTGTHIHTDECM